MLCNIPKIKAKEMIFSEDRFHFITRNKNRNRPKTVPVREKRELLVLRYSDVFILSAFGQVNGEGASAVGIVFDRNAAAMNLNNMFDNGQTETGSAAFLAARRIDPIKALENTILMDSRNTGTFVDKIDFQRVLSRTRNRYRYFFGLRFGCARIFNSVVDQIDKRLFQHFRDDKSIIVIFWLFYTNGNKFFSGGLLTIGRCQAE